MGSILSKLNNYDYDYFYKKYYIDNMTTYDIANGLNVAGSSVVRKMKTLGFCLNRRMTVSCSFCGKQLSRQKSEYIKQNNFYCNKICEVEHKKETMSGGGNPFYGRKHTEQTKLKFSKTHKGKTISSEMRKSISKKLSGKNSPFWKHGNNERNLDDRKKMDYREWRTKVFERDKYTCQKCFQVGDKLAGHHIYGFADHKELRFDTDNGITLCRGCHLLFHSIYGKGKNDKDQLTAFLDGEKIELTGS